MVQPDSDAPVMMMMEPWHCFTAMFLAFWAVSAYFDHFLMTLVFCIAFGVMSEIFVKSRPRDKDEVVDDFVEKNKQKLKLLEKEKMRQELEILEMKKQEERLMCSVESADVRTEDLLVTSNNADSSSPPPPIPSRDYQGKFDVAQDDDDCPPPLPAKDFGHRRQNAVETTDSLVRDCDDDVPPPLPCKNKDIVTMTEEDVTSIVEDDVPPPLPSKDFVSNPKEDILDDETVTCVEQPEDLCPQPSESNILIQESCLDVDILDIDEDEVEECPPKLPEKDFDCSNPIIQSCEEPESPILSSDETDAQNLLIDMDTSVEENEESSSHDAVNNLSSIMINEDNQTIIEDNATLNQNILDNIHTSEKTVSNTLIDFSNSNESNDTCENSFDSSTSSTDKSVSDELSESPDIPTKLITEEENLEVNMKSISETKSDELLTDNLSSSSESGLITSNSDVIEQIEIRHDLDEDQDELEIDLTDPSVEAAATKIQSVFKGYKIRKEMKTQ